MDIVLLILKIIGIILLSIIGLIFFIILVVLLTPIRYRIKGGYREKPDVMLNIHLWFHLISAKVLYNDQGLNGTLRIFFIKKKLLSSSKEENKADQNISDDIEQELDKIEAETEAEIEGKSDDQAEIENSSPPDSEEQIVETEEPEITDETENSEESAEVEVETKEEDLEKEPEEQEEENKSIVDRIVSKIKGIYDKISEKIANLKKKKDAVMWLLDQPSTKNIIARSIKQIKKTIKGILPRKLEGYLRLGLEDPKTMGMICMYAGIFYPSLPKKFEFTPEFGEKIIDGDVDIKGRIILGAVLAHLVKIALCRDFFRFLKNLKRFKNRWR